MTKPPKAGVEVRNTEPRDLDSIIALCKRVYLQSTPWTREQLQSHQGLFPEGQFVAVETSSDRVVGMAASLIVQWDDYAITDTWRDFTDSGWFTNHDVTGQTLYAAEVMVDPSVQGRGIGKKIYAARRDLVHRRELRRIRAGARLRGYCRHRDQLSPEEYVQKVIRGELADPTLSFQLKQGFRVLGVVRDYLHADEESCGHAALIEWINHRVAQRRDTYGRDPRFARPRKPRANE